MQAIRPLLLFVLMAFFPFRGLAEYNAWYTEFEARAENGTIHRGFIYLVAAYAKEDSLQDEAYLARLFDRMDGKANDSISYATDLISYPVYAEDFSDTIFSYTTRGKASLPVKGLKSLKITNRIAYSYINTMRILDHGPNLDWLNEKPLRKVWFSGYLCERTFFIHKESERTRQFTAALLKYEETFEKQKQEMEASAQNGDAKTREAVEEQLEQLKERRDKKIQFWEEMLKGEKVVSLGSCSC